MQRQASKLEETVQVVDATRQDIRGGPVALRKEKQRSTVEKGDEIARLGHF